MARVPPPMSIRQVNQRASSSETPTNGPEQPTTMPYTTHPPPPTSTSLTSSHSSHTLVPTARSSITLVVPNQPEAGERPSRHTAVPPNTPRVSNEPQDAHLTQSHQQLLDEKPGKLKKLGQKIKGLLKKMVGKK